MGVCTPRWSIFIHPVIQRWFSLPSTFPSCALLKDSNPCRNLGNLRISIKLFGEVWAVLDQTLVPDYWRVIVSEYRNRPDFFTKLTPLNGISTLLLQGVSLNENRRPVW